MLDLVQVPSASKPMCVQAAGGTPSQQPVLFTPTHITGMLMALAQRAPSALRQQASRLAANVARR